MTDKEPTQEQIKELWEWCGLYRKKHPKWDWFMWYSPDGAYLGNDPPDLDLNNLFKYAVPKATQELMKKNDGWTKLRAIHYLFQAWEIEYSWRQSTFEWDLFWVIWRVIKK